jgi:regulator of sigma E protease
LIIVHESGHYVVARWCRIRIERFSIGFGPTVLERTSQRTGTTFRLGLIPLGGFVHIRGMDIGRDVAPDDRHAYPSRPIWQRLVTILAGPAISYLSVAAIAMALYTCHGVDAPRFYGVGAVITGYDTFGKLEPGDRILAVDHVPQYIDRGPTLTERINASNGAPITLTIERDGHERDLQIEPRQDEDASGWPTWRIGVQYAPQNVAARLGLVDAAGRAPTYPVVQAEAIGKALYAWCS